MSLFKLAEKNTTVKKELIGALTTFLTASYIIFVNPSVLSATGMPFNALITATCLIIIISCILVAFIANVPFLIAPGMGLNAFFAYTLVVSGKVPWQTALGIVFISGVIFIILTFFKVREMVIYSLPEGFKASIPAGVGLFLCFIGLKSMGLITGNDATIVSMGKFTPGLIIGLIGLLVIIFFMIKGVKGSILYGILIATALGIIFKQSALPTHIIAMPPSIGPIFLHLDIIAALHWGFIGAIFSFVFVNLFDSASTAMACSIEGKLYNKKGEIENIEKILFVDALSTTCASLIGSSSATTFVESATGIAEGAKTGLAALFMGLFFLIALFFSPIISIVPAFATAPALVIVGIIMFKNINRVNLVNLEDAIPAFFTTIIMPLTYSITTGISFGFILYVVVKIFVGNTKEVNSVMWILAAISVANLVFMMFSK
ncbi:MAG: NCS2 family permease [Fusobacteria bacterium]|nr:NCS2 family permease [Fusobacteriota bacterium]